MKTWLKGGLIAGGIGIIIFWLLMIDSSLKWGLWNCSSVVDSYSCNLSEFIFSPVHWITAILFGIIGGILGSVIGYIYSKIKSKKQNEPKPIQPKTTS